MLQCIRRTLYDPPYDILTTTKVKNISSVGITLFGNVARLLIVLPDGVRIYKKIHVRTQ